MSWSSEEEDVREYTPLPQRKDLNTLLAELEDIKNHIEDIKAKQWYLAKLMKFHREGIPEW